MFGKTLKDFRKARGLSQRSLAAQVGVDFTYLSKLENGVLPPPADETIVKIAAALAVDTDELLLAAHRVPPDVSNLVVRSKSIPALLRATKDLDENELHALLEFAQHFRGQ